MSRRDGFFIAAGSLALVAAFAPISLGFLALIGLAFFFKALEGKTLRSAFGVGYLFGLILNGGTLYWIGWATPPGAIGGVMYLALYWGLFGLMLAWFSRVWGKRSLWFAPVLWTSLEILGSLGPLGFPWNGLGYALAGRPEWIQYAAVTGVLGVTFWIVLMNVLIVEIWNNRSNRSRWKAAIVFLVLLALPLGYGLSSMRHPISRSETLRVGLVQGNIDPYVPWSPILVESSQEVYARLTREIAAEKPDLIVWPEAAIPTYLDHDRASRKWLLTFSDSLRIPILTGAFDFNVNDKSQYYNSAYFISPGRSDLDRYYKIRLVPFSERIPWISEIPPLYRLSKRLIMDIGDYTPGDSCVVFNNHNHRKPYRFSTAICFDSVFPDLVRRFVSGGAQFLVIITNDGWFGRTSGPYQHAKIAVLRAIENRVWVARCANTGVSEFVDPYGRVVGATPIYKEAALSTEIGLSEKPTWFTLHGQSVPWFFGFAAAGSVGLTGAKQVFSRRRKS